MAMENNNVNYRFEVFVGSILTIAILGILGNGLSLSSMLNATFKESHGFGKAKWSRNTLFVFNIVLVDLLACLLILTELVYGYIIFQDPKHKYSKALCHFIIIGVQDLAQITGWSIAFLSFWHALNRFSESTSAFREKVSQSKLVYLILVALWIMPILINIPKSLENNVEFTPGKGNEFGYLCYSKIQTSTNVENPIVVVFTLRQYILNLANDLAILVVIVGSGLVTLLRFRQNAKAKEEKVKDRHPVEALRIKIQARIVKSHIAITASVIGIFYLIFRLPLYIMANPWAANGQDYLATGATVILYMMQFCCHFLIHTLLSKSYREAFKDLLRPIFPCCFKCKPCMKKEENIEENKEVSNV